MYIVNPKNVYCLTYSESNKKNQISKIKSTLFHILLHLHLYLLMYIVQSSQFTKQQEKQG